MMFMLNQNEYLFGLETNVFCDIKQILWLLDLQLPMQSVSINIGSSNPAHGEVYNIVW